MRNNGGTSLQSPVAENWVSWLSSVFRKSPTYTVSSVQNFCSRFHFPLLQHGVTFLCVWCMCLSCLLVGYDTAKVAPYIRKCLICGGFHFWAKFYVMHLVSRNTLYGNYMMLDCSNHKGWGASIADRKVKPAALTEPHLGQLERQTSLSGTETTLLCFKDILDFSSLATSF